METFCEAWTTQGACSAEQEKVRNSPVSSKVNGGRRPSHATLRWPFCVPGRYEEQGHTFWTGGAPDSGKHWVDMGFRTTVVFWVVRVFGVPVHPPCEVPCHRCRYRCWKCSFQDGKLRLLYEAAPMSFLLEQVRYVVVFCQQRNKESFATQAPFHPCISSIDHECN